MVHHTHSAKFLTILIAITSICYAPVSWGDVTGKFLVLPNINGSYHSDPDEYDYEFSADLFATLEKDRFRFLAEYMLSNEEQELERFQLGLSFNKNLLWLGRFHNPIGYWNTQYHHGRFFETSISRPAIVEFEHDGGLLPLHQSGLLLEGILNHGKQTMGYKWSIGVGPDLKNELEPWDVLSPRSGTHDISTTLNLYLDSIFNNSAIIGLFVNYTEIPADVIDVNEIQQISSGLYANWESMPWRLIGSSFYVHNDISHSTWSEDDTFVSAYLQAEYSLRENWIFFSRIEGTADDEDDAYLALFPEFVEDRILGGIRYDFANNNALKLEISGNHTDNDDFAKVILQWSAVF
jgi:hypothetical protein